MREQTALSRQFGRVVNDLVLTEMLLLQAAIESAGAVNDGVLRVSQRLRGEVDQADVSLGDLLQQTAEQALEPYGVRLKYLRSWLEQNR